MRGYVPTVYYGRIYADMGGIALSCGCVRGARWCLEAQELHEKREQLWRELQGIPINDHRWAPYDELTELLDIHFGNEPVGRTR